MRCNGSSNVFPIVHVTKSPTKCWFTTLPCWQSNKRIFWQVLLFNLTVKAKQELITVLANWNPCLNFFCFNLPIGAEKNCGLKNRERTSRIRNMPPRPKQMPHKTLENVQLTSWLDFWTWQPSSNSLYTYFEVTFNEVSSDLHEFHSN